MTIDEMVDKHHGIVGNHETCNGEVQIRKLDSTVAWILACLKCGATTLNGLKVINKPWLEEARHDKRGA